MSYEISIAFFLCAFVFMLMSALIFRPKNSGFTPQDFFIVFFLIQYGPHAAFPGEMLRLGEPRTIEDDTKYINLLSSAYVSIGFFLYIGNYLYAYLFGGVSFFPGKNDIFISMQNKKKITIAAILYIFVFLAIQGPSLSVTKEYVLYLAGGSSYSYVQIRREIFSDNFYTSTANTLRHNITAVIFSLLLMGFIATRKISYAFLAAGVFVFAAAQLNKFPTVYFLLLSSLIYYSYKNNGKIYIGGASAVIKVFCLIFVVYYILSALYSIQYSGEISSGIVSEEALDKVLPYRLFFASNDGLRLWMMYFPNVSEFVGMSNIKAYAEFFEIDYFNPTKKVPEYFLGTDLTTIQVGFMGAGYASFGTYGVIFYAAIVSVLASFVSSFGIAIQDKNLRSIWISLVGLNMIFVGTRELHTALISGGVISAPIFLFLIFEYFKRKM